MAYDQLRYSTIEDWIRLRPIIGLYKIARRGAIRHAFVLKRAPDARALTNIRQQFGARPLALTIAYNSVWMLKWQIRFAKLNFHEIDHLIADNSSDRIAAQEIEQLCRNAGIAYLKLPFNRFSLGRPQDSSLSHASALNWVWQRIVRPVRPPVVAILDHDLIPLRPVDFSSKVAHQPFFGLITRGARYGWQIWPGYTVFERSILDRYDLDFWIDGRAGLDTGGANWRRIYRHFDPDRLRFPDMTQAGRGRFDEWWHVGGASEYAAKPESWRQEIEATLEREYEACLKSSRTTALK